MKSSERTSELLRCIEDLTAIWLRWMHYHRQSNDETLSYARRRAAAEESQRLQLERQKQIEKINFIVDEDWRDADSV